MSRPLGYWPRPKPLAATGSVSGRPVRGLPKLEPACQSVVRWCAMSGPGSPACPSQPPAMCLIGSGGPHLETSQMDALEPPLTELLPISPRQFSPASKRRPPPSRRLGLWDLVASPVALHSPVHHFFASDRRASLLGLLACQRQLALQDSGQQTHQGTSTSSRHPGESTPSHPQRLRTTSTSV